MNLRSKIAVSLLAFLISSPSFAGKSEYSSTSQSSKPSGSNFLLADSSKKKAATGGREKHIVREGRTKSKDSRNIDFDSVDIGGERKTPLGTLVNNNKLDKNYDFVKIRLRWHPEMVQSASSLDSGSSSQ